MYELRPAGPPAFFFDFDPCPLIHMFSVLGRRCICLHTYCGDGDGDTGDSRELRGAELNICS